MRGKWRAALEQGRMPPLDDLCLDSNILKTILKDYALVWQYQLNGLVVT